MPTDGDKEYEPLRRDSSERWSDSNHDNLTAASPNRQLRRIQSSALIAAVVATILLVLSLTANVFLALKLQPRPALREGDCGSEHAGLKRDVPIQISHDTDYTNDNLTAVTKLWEKLSGDPGVVALRQEYVKEKRLPHALRFPWDEDKGRTLFRYVMYTEQGLPQHIALSHALHCLDQLRQDVICNADDTPRYAGFQDPPGTGSGQVRMCRDWSKLEQWALERTACFKHEDEVPGPMIERFKSCPDGRVLWPTSAATARVSSALPKGSML